MRQRLDVLKRYPRRHWARFESVERTLGFFSTLPAPDDEAAWAAWEAAQPPLDRPPADTARSRLRRPFFFLTAAQAVRNCQALHLPLALAGHMQALKTMMRYHGWPVAVLALHAQVSRTQIGRFLELKTCLTTVSFSRVIEALGLEEPEFYLLAKWLLDLEVLGCQH